MPILASRQGRRSHELFTLGDGLDDKPELRKKNQMKKQNLVTIVVIVTFFHGSICNGCCFPMWRCNHIGQVQLESDKNG